MPQAQNIALTNGVADITFSPVKVADTAIFKAPASIEAGRPAVTVNHRLVSKDQAARTQLRLRVPVVATVDGVEQVVRESTVLIDVITAPDSTSTERADLRARASDLLADALVSAVVDNGECVFG